MNKDLDETRALIEGLKQKIRLPRGATRVIVCPPFTSLQLAHSLLDNTLIALGAQNMSSEDDGAFTGEVSARMLKSTGCTYVILGHSERRQLFGESSELVNRKVKKALEAGLTPIVCVGETLQDRESGVTEKIVGDQVRASLAGIAATDIDRLIIAYEPVWAIGTGRNATPEQAEAVHAFIRALIRVLFQPGTSERLIIQYGGSVKPENARDLLRQPNIDGALVGGACLKADSFAAIIESA